MGFHLVAIVAARGFLHLFHLSAPLLWPLNLWLPLPRHLPAACAALYGGVVFHAALLRRAYARRGGGGNVWSRSIRGGDGGGGEADELLRQALLSISY
ncbi:uncharacterized protein [Oryza sativa Japonica Group]|jgi:hypothetical protein|uniref:Os04g0649600 protein n=4 Tax=Oryza TaxID=4527 RepID=Q7XMQ7_ORYSJ|nr:uncharacterized protein LOC4337220 [Oryza sativa Japonica Group]EAY95822.1 hypothetical protein OsI_17691 [Oryza sativa Indica Group]KAB8097249.1 hypothetical protein EE612_025953 [Oryza sativa]KAF2936220.1 hypothetical protein DAI22_04g287301 [Oryza sativa Japonica Group]CAE04494.1 OSJNBb0059K02.4 [Oryza sativa Japonica Group]BAF15998.1 Os04g0649600 [Oryza sativa Japonica Group]|eukprot:NP_001054084.1 Os04g0649600 [Oryza sativa Japonica Group]